MDEVPKTTAQQKKFSTKTKTFYKTSKIKQSEYLLVRALSGKQPRKTYNTPIELSVTWLFPHTKKSKDGERKGTRPDLDNLQKLLQDIMCKLGYYKDDSLITDLTIKKRWHRHSGLIIEIKEVETIDNELNKEIEELINGKE
uniref:Endodeoxyribonuclease RusA n=1 Tax=Siphoviridae sp. ctJjf17 TaxID=2827839 RepID=A0A8S5SA79_9CAUD|nr:MAG TPA: Endodeoxyribonuclease RusA [Siphoviridae sp. ctJjf17]